MWRQGQSVRGDWRSARPRWWLLYVIAVLLVAAVGLAEVLVQGDGLRKTVEALAVVAGFGLIAAWGHLNRIALELERGRRRP